MADPAGGTVVHAVADHSFVLEEVDRKGHHQGHHRIRDHQLVGCFSDLVRRSSSQLRQGVVSGSTYRV